MEKSLKEQLGVLLPSLGFKISEEDKILKVSKVKQTSKRTSVSKMYVSKAERNEEWIKTIINWSKQGREGKIISHAYLPDILDNVLDYIEVARSNKRISILDEFFCLCALQGALNSPSKHFDDLLSRICKVASKITALIRNRSSGISSNDIELLKPFIEKQQILLEKKKEEKRISEMKHREVELERQKRKELRRLIEELIEKHINCAIGQPFLNDQDVRLAIKWWNRASFQIPSRESLIADFRKDYELGRLLSARSAEKAAIEFYRDTCKFKVEDISIQQVTNNECTNWMDYDLNVNGVPVDVKNSRRSQHSPKSYTEHCVPSFKHSRNNQQVRVCGVFSPYLSAYKLLDPLTDQQDKLFILGETTLTDQVALKSEFEDSELLQIELHRQNSGTKFFLPPWMFNYPKWAYKNRDNILKKAKGITFPDAKSCRAEEINPIPLCIAARIDLKQYWDNDDLSIWEWEFFHELSERLDRSGLSLPILFLSVLKHFLLMVTRSSGNINGYVPNNYKKFIFYNNRFDVPLGICDPLETISVLIDCLNTLWTADHDLIRSYKTFKLQGFNILLAKSRSGTDKWQTLIAYCGGRSPINKAACGNNPLVLGACEHCQICGKLICPKCDFCSKGCARKSQSPLNDFSEDIPPNICIAD